MSNEVEFWRDPKMDAIIEDVIDIFKLDGVELVRLSGMTQRARNISGLHDIPHQAIDGIIRKLNAAGIIKFHYITKCPHCGEISYQVKYDGVSPIGPKLCDTCSTMFQPVNGSTLEK
jgi:hypothetical protein